MIGQTINLIAKIFNKNQQQNSQEEQQQQTSGQQKLFTPGPLCTSDRVKETMMIDYGSRDPVFIQFIKDIRNDILKICQTKQGNYECVIVQGSGTFGVEATIGSAIPKDNHKLLVCINGAYGHRISKIAKYLNVNYIELVYQDNEEVKAEDVEKKLKENPDITHVACIHSETTSGIINDVAAIGKVIKQVNPEIQYIVDSMSSFGVYELFPEEQGIDYLVASSNKNLQGVPGFAFVVARTDLLKKTQENARSLVLDLYDQWQGLEKNGQFRFTPPTHVIRATKEAIDEYFEEGGIKARYNRYNENQIYMCSEFQKLGFKLYVDSKIQGCIITTFIQPTNKEFDFKEFYDYLADKQLCIYPGKLTTAETFRIGSIGHLQRKDFENLIQEVKNYLNKKNIQLPVSYE